MNKDMRLRLEEAMLGGVTPSEKTSKGKTKIARLTTLGWRIIEVPMFWGARQLWHDNKGGGNPAYIDFKHCREWLVIPPDDVDMMARKITGRICAIRWACRQAGVF